MQFGVFEFFPAKYAVVHLKKKTSFMACHSNDLKLNLQDNSEIIALLKTSLKFIHLLLNPANPRCGRHLIKTDNNHAINSYEHLEIASFFAIILIVN